MRHRKDHRKLGRTAAHRRAVLRNLVTALFEYERIGTTVAKAKETRRIAERMITFAKRGDVAARRHVSSYIMRPAVTAKLFSEIAPWYADRNGGYTRILRAGLRLGDAGETAYLELIKSEEQKAKEREDRMAVAEAKASKGDTTKSRGGGKTGGADGAKTKRGKREAGPSVAAPARKRGRAGVKTG